MNLWQAMDFYHLLKVFVHMQLKLLKVWAISINCFKENNSKTAEATGGFIGNIIPDKIKSISKSPKEFHLQNILKELHSKTDENEIEIPKKGYTSPKKTTIY